MVSAVLHSGTVFLFSFVASDLQYCPCEDTAGSIPSPFFFLSLQIQLAVPLLRRCHPFYFPLPPCNLQCPSFQKHRTFCFLSPQTNLQSPAPTRAPPFLLSVTANRLALPPPVKAPLTLFPVSITPLQCLFLPRHHHFCFLAPQTNLQCLLPHRHPCLYSCYHKPNCSACSCEGTTVSVSRPCTALQCLYCERHHCFCFLSPPTDLQCLLLRKHRRSFCFQLPQNSKAVPVLAKAPPSLFYVATPWIPMQALPFLGSVAAN